MHWNRQHRSGKSQCSITANTNYIHVCLLLTVEYAQVTKMLGNGRLEATCFDGTKRLCHIRGKLRKKVCNFAVVRIRIFMCVYNCHLSRNYAYILHHFLTGIFSDSLQVQLDHKK